MTTAITDEELKELRRKEKKASYMRQYYDTHPEAREKKREADRRRIAANRESERARVSKYYKENTEARKKWANSHQLKAKKRAVAVLGGKCQRCGWDEHPAALQFHHRDPQLKRFNITTKILTTTKRFPWDMVLEEIEKCDLLCANCHFIVESKWELEGIWPIEES